MRPAPQQGWVVPWLATEFPGLAVSWVEVEGGAGRSPEPVRAHLRTLSDRIYGPQAIRLREQPVPWSYRVFFRQIGLDPDVTRTPVEQLIFERLHDGGFKSQGLPADALTIATVETGVALRAFDADYLEGKLCIRESMPDEALAGDPVALDPGTLVLADEAHTLGLLFGASAEPAMVGKESRRVAIAAVSVGSVSQMAIGEALWMAAQTLAGE
ncbi:MAG TPA: phenylalanine--tRNA ligase beta subunit-related protein [Solirubrobacterales bacterium]|jgi:DNA/RNA-binding domain of Phe-tRNA-synthetase-like protein|nr:phenylalanine--tRNA ligase beta subunit-related protein [Solirubrobacterales bacterium]